MSKVVINSYEEFERLLGQQIGVSDWLEVTQERINQFADATLDHQWIHVDVERAKTEKPFQEHHCTRLSDPFPASVFSGIRLSK